MQLGELAARGMVLAAGAKVFASLGVRAATVEDILQVAGVSRRTFYRLYGNKEAVVAALYQLGTERLLVTCRIAAEEERDPLRRAERFIDAHLTNARDFGRLVFVLGGEAQSHESHLHARRMEIQDALIDLLATVNLPKSAPANDPLLIRGVLLALEAVTRRVLEEGDDGRKVTPAALDRARRVMMRIATSALAGKGAGVAPLPGVER